MTLMRIAALGLVFFATLPVRGAELAARDRDFLLRAVDAHARQSGEAALAIWRYAEVGYQEKQSSALLQKELADAGFTGPSTAPTSPRTTTERAGRPGTQRATT